MQVVLGKKASITYVCIICVFSIVAIILSQLLTQCLVLLCNILMTTSQSLQAYRATMLLKMLHNFCNTSVLRVLLIYAHSPSGAVRPWESCIYFSQIPYGRVTVIILMYIHIYLCAGQELTHRMTLTQHTHTCTHRHACI